MTKFHLGVNLGHDRSAALVVDGEVVVAIQQERLDRYKHSVGFPAQSGADPTHMELPLEAINYCMDSVGIGWDAIASVVANMPGKDYGADILRRKLPKAQHEKILTMPSHHLAHAYTAFWPSGFDRALVLVADASGSTDADNLTESYSLYEGSGTRLDLIHAEKVQAHLAQLSTLGFVYEYIARKAGFVTELKGGVCVPESGKLMGLAPYGGPQPQWRQWIQTQADSYSLKIPAYDIFLEVAALEKLYDDGAGKAYLRPYMVDLAFKVQDELERALLHIVQLARKAHGFTHVCLAGGVALNSVANYLLLREAQLEDIFTYPAAGDAGIAAGCALWAYATEERGTRRAVMTRADLGRRYPCETVADALTHYADTLCVEELSDEDVVSRTAEALAKGHIVARVDGRCEFGPRALGHRSILADPNFDKMRDIINARVKFREPFRPFAPVIPEERVNEVFEQEVASPFMLLISPIREQYRAQIPSVTHHDGTGRLQTVTSADNPFFHALCHRIAELRDGPPVILNTSFNVAGQPIVETPDEAISTFLSTDIDYCSVGNFWLSRKDAPVLDYAEHLARVTDVSLPKGLPPEQEAVDELMQTLDAALFAGKRDGTPWREEELRALSLEGARFKETTLQFQAGPLGNAVTTQLDDKAVLVLNPLGQSYLHDLQGNRKPRAYDYAQVQLLLAVFRGDAEQLSAMRRARHLTTQAWREACQWANAQLARIGVAAADLMEAAPATREVDVSPFSYPSDTLAAFASEGFSLMDELGALRTVLMQADYTEARIAEKLGVDSLQQIEPTCLHYYDQYRLGAEAIDHLIRLFLLRVTLDHDVAVTVFGESLLATLQNIGVLRACDHGIASRVDVFAVEGLYVATDHRFMLSEDDRISEDPVMYIGLDSLGLAYVAPRYPCHTVLDLCTGSGVQALTASRYAESVYAVDLNPRAIRFARFNAQLNGVDNVTVLRSDLYESLDQDRRFDVILANPPFVPSPDHSLKFRDGGAQGEALLSRIIREADAHLAPAGKLHIVTDLVQVDEYAHKLRRWWQGGPARQVVFTTADRDELLFSVPHANYPFGQTFEEYNQELSRWVDNFRRSELGRVNFGYILIHRDPAHEQTSYTSKVIHSPRRPISDAVEKYLDQLRMLDTCAQDRLYLRLHPKLGWREARRFDEGGGDIELYVDDDPLFTGYRISSGLLAVLQQIGHRPMPIHAIVDPTLRAGLLGLIRKGVVWVSPQIPRYGQVRTGVRTDAAARTNTPAHDTILENASCTTPTCLTSYMRG